MPVTVPVGGDRFLPQGHTGMLHPEQQLPIPSSQMLSIRNT